RSASKNGAKAHLVAAAEHNALTVLDSLEKFGIDCILAITDGHYIYICATNLTKCIEIIISYFVGNGGCGGDDFDSRRGAARFFHDAAENPQFKEVKIATVNLSFLQIRSLVLSSTNSNEFSFRMLHGSAN